MWDRKTVPAVTNAMLGILEGCKLKAHYDSLSHQYDIGYGSLTMPNGMFVKPGDVITQDQADVLLDVQMLRWATAIASSVHWTLTENQAAAVICFIHNVGIGALSGSSTFIKMLNGGRIDLAAGQFIGWSHSGGKLIPGLMKRNEWQKQIMVGEADPYSKEEYEKVWAMTVGELMIPYRQAYSDAEKWGYTGSTGPSLSPIAPSSARPSAAVSVSSDDAETARLNDNEAAAMRNS